MNETELSNTEDKDLLKEYFEAVDDLSALLEKHLGVIMLQVPWNTVALQNCETATAIRGTTVTKVIEQHH